MRVQASAVAVILTLFLGGIVSASQIGPGRQVQKVSLEAHLEQMAGANPIDCGRHGRSVNDYAAMTRSLRCGLDAAMSGKAFLIIKDVQGIDSILAHGLLSSGDGKILWFSYDSAPCGGPGCADRFETRPCLSPTVSSDGPARRTSFVCR